MSNFWANKLGAANQPAAPAQAPQPQPQPTSGPWWAPGQQHQPHPAAAPAQQTVPGAQPGKPPARAMVSKQNTHCPDCGGDDFFKPHGNPQAMSQCYTCGYNPRFQQTAAGLPSGDKSTPSTPARQTASGGAGGRSNYDPSHIVDVIR